MSLPKNNRYIHLAAAVVFTALAFFASFMHPQDELHRNVFRIVTLAVAGLAWLLFFRTRRMERQKDEKERRVSSFPEGQARLIDSGRLPHRFNTRIVLNEQEICHFSVDASRIIFEPLPPKMRVDPTRLLVRYSGGNFYFIVRPQEILMPATVETETAGELIITNQRIVFLAKENAFEVPLQKLKMLDCSAHLVDFRVHGKRYTLKTDAAEYAEKVMRLIFQAPQDH